MADETLDNTQYVTIKQERLHDAAQTDIQRDGDRLTIGAAHYRIIGRDANGDYVVERLPEGA